MAIFGKKKTITRSDDETVHADILEDSAYREELKELGRKKFQDLIESQAEHVAQEIDKMLEQISADVKVSVGRKVDMLMGRLNAEISNQLNERMREYNRVSGDAQELVAQSLSRNAQMVHEKYQQLSLNLQRVVADQEVMMATVFQDSKTQMANVQSQQEKVLEELRETASITRKEAEELSRALTSTVNEQSTRLKTVFEENMTSVELTREKQSAMLDTLHRTTQELEEQYRQLRELLDTSIEHQKTMIAETINENMARIVEHYLIGALGEQSSIREQLPSILERMEENKQAMMDDMKL